MREGGSEGGMDGPYPNTLCGPSLTVSSLVRESRGRNSGDGWRGLNPAVCDGAGARLQRKML